MLSRRSFTFTGFAAAAAGCRRKKSPGFNGYAYVANEAGNAIAVVDLTAFAVARHIPLDDSPNAVIAASRSVPRLRARAPAGNGLRNRHGQVLDRAAGQGRACIVDAYDGRFFVGVRPSKSYPDPPGFFPAEVHACRLPVDAYDFDLAKNYATVSYGPAGSVSIADLNARKVSSPVKVSDAIGLARFRPDGDGLLIADTAARQLCVLDQHAAVIVRLPLAVRPDNLCFNQDGGQLFITGEGQDAVVVIFPYYVPQVAETVLAGHAPGAMAASSAHLFLANPKAGDVTILSIRAKEDSGGNRGRGGPGFHSGHA